MRAADAAFGDIACVCAARVPPHHIAGESDVARAIVSAGCEPNGQHGLWPSAVRIGKQWLLSFLVGHKTIPLGENVFEMKYLAGDPLPGQQVERRIAIDGNAAQPARKLVDHHARSDAGGVDRTPGRAAVMRSCA